MSNNWVRENKELIHEVEQKLQAAYQENEIYHSEIDVQDFEIPSLDRERDAYSVSPSAALFWSDRDTYYEELNFCLLKHHEQAIEYLKNNDLHPMFYDLVDAIRLNRIAPFVGAGMSCPSKFPLWGEALSDLLSKLDGIDVDKTKQLIGKAAFFEAAQLMWEHDSTQVKSFIRNRFAKRRIPVSGATGPVELLPQLSRGCIITTNFDSVIEEIAGPFEGYMHGLQAGNKFVPKLIKGGRCILKLHGDAEDHETYVLTDEQYKAAYGDPIDYKLPLPKALRQIYISHSLLFLGCSLEEDKTLEVFKEVKKDHRFDIPDHFAFLPEPNNSKKRKKKENTLINLNIHPIWYPEGEHDFVEKYLKLAIDLAQDRLEAF